MSSSSSLSSFLFYSVSACICAISSNVWYFSLLRIHSRTMPLFIVLCSLLHVHIESTSVYRIWFVCWTQKHNVQQQQKGISFCVVSINDGFLLVTLYRHSIEPFFFLEMNWAPNFRWKSPENKLYPMKQWNETRKSCNLNNMLYLHEERNHLAIHTYNIIYKMRCTQRQPSNEWTQQIKRDTRAHASIFHIDSAHKYRYGRLKFYRALYNHFERVSVCLWCIYEWEKTDTTSTSARSNWQRVRSQAACALTQPKRKKTSLWK